MEISEGASRPGCFIPRIKKYEVVRTAFFLSRRCVDKRTCFVSVGNRAQLLVHPAPSLVTIQREQSCLCVPPNFVPFYAACVIIKV
jgi:hypothetical protein